MVLSLAGPAAGGRRARASTLRTNFRLPAAGAG